MSKTICFLLLLFGLCASSPAQEGTILNTVSPKLRQFLTKNPAAFRILTNTLAEAFARRTVQVYYFYSDDESIARAYHYYPDESVVGIVIRENQQPLDEFLCLVFESLNSTGQKSFLELRAKAGSGEISKTAFPREVRRVEFNAIRRTRDLLAGLKLRKGETLKSYFYKRLRDCPDDFEAFLLYNKKVSPQRDATQHYEMMYDLLQKH
jgi:hypothetical protein